MGVVSECGTLQDVIITASLGEGNNRGREEKRKRGEEDQDRSKESEGLKATRVHYTIECKLLLAVKTSPGQSATWA